MTLSLTQTSQQHDDTEPAVRPLFYVVESHVEGGLDYLVTRKTCTCPDRVFRVPALEDRETCKHQDEIVAEGAARFPETIALPHGRNQVRIGSVVTLTEGRGGRLPAGLSVVDVVVSAFTGDITVIVETEAGTKHLVAPADIFEVLAL
ncbi:MAG: hypothetical protein JWL97_4242 [Gemmatimonadales bacterium]|nr:hypothetical protein [Gemmatimonadales bacterium]